MTEPYSHRDVHQLDQAPALAAFANPFRARILDALIVDGPSTASQLAKRTGQAVGSTSHHLKVLAEAGLIVEAEGITSDRRQRYWKRAHPSMRWARREMSDPSARAAAFEAELVSLERQFQRAKEAVLNSEETMDDSGAFASQQWLTMSAAELDELSEELVAVLHRWRQRDIPDDGVERETCFVFTRGFPAQP